MGSARGNYACGGYGRRGLCGGHAGRRVPTRGMAWLCSASSVDGVDGVDGICKSKVEVARMGTWC